MTIYESTNESTKPQAGTCRACLHVSFRDNKINVAVLCMDTSEGLRDSVEVRSSATGTLKMNIVGFTEPDLQFLRHPAKRYYWTRYDSSDSTCWTLIDTKPDFRNNSTNGARGRAESSAILSVTLVHASGTYVVRVDHLTYTFERGGKRVAR